MSCLSISFCFLKTELQFYWRRHDDQPQIPSSPNFFITTRGQWEICEIFQNESTRIEKKIFSSFLFPFLSMPWICVILGSRAVIWQPCMSVRMMKWQKRKLENMCFMTAHLNPSANLKWVPSWLSVNWGTWIPVYLSHCIIWVFSYLKFIRSIELRAFFIPYVLLSPGNWLSHIVNLPYNLFSPKHHIFAVISWERKNRFSSFWFIFKIKEIFS